MRVSVKVMLPILCWPHDISGRCRSQTFLSISNDFFFFLTNWQSGKIMPDMKVHIKSKCIHQHLLNVYRNQTMDVNTSVLGNAFQQG